MEGGERELEQRGREKDGQKEGGGKKEEEEL